MEIILVFAMDHILIVGIHTTLRTTGNVVMSAFFKVSNVMETVRKAGISAEMSLAFVKTWTTITTFSIDRMKVQPVLVIPTTTSTTSENVMTSV